MKKAVNIIILVFVVLLALLLKSINFIFPLAPTSPTFGEIENYEVSYVQKMVSSEQYEFSYDQQLIQLEQNEFAQTIEYLQKAKPTRESSMNDRPSRYPHYEITIFSEDIVNPANKLYIYEYGEKVYYEIPYTGIYEVDENILTILY